MALEFAFGLPFSINLSLIIVYFINAIVALIAIMIADQVIAHHVEPKRAFGLAVLALVLTPLAAPYIGLTGTMATLILPLVVWIAFGELILENDRITKLKVLGVAFVVYYIMSIFVAPYLYGLMSMILPF